MHCATSRTAPGSIPGGVTGDCFRGSPRRNHVPWGRLSLWKWVPGISPGVKAAGAFGWRPTTLVVPKRQENPGPQSTRNPLGHFGLSRETFTFLYDIILYHIILYVSYHFILYHIILYYMVLYYITLYYIISYYIILHYIVLYYISYYIILH